MTRTCWTSQSDLRKLAHAAASYRGVLAIEPNNVDAHFNLGVVLQDAGQWKQAREAYQAALDIDGSITDAQSAVVAIDAALGRINAEM